MEHHFAKGTTRPSDSPFQFGFKFEPAVVELQEQQQQQDQPSLETKPSKSKKKRDKRKKKTSSESATHVTPTFSLMETGSKEPLSEAATAKPELSRAKETVKPYDARQSQTAQQPKHAVPNVVTSSAVSGAARREARASSVSTAPATMRKPGPMPPAMPAGLRGKAKNRIKAKKAQAKREQASKKDAQRREAAPAPPASCRLGEEPEFQTWRDPQLTEEERMKRRFGQGIRNLKAIGQRSNTHASAGEDSAPVETTVSHTSPFSFGFTF
jgi:hypothetical protein